MQKLLSRISLCCLILCMVLCLAVPAFAEETYTKATLAVENVTAEAGKEVKVAIEMYNNPGIVSMTLDVHYDDDALKLVKVADGGLIGAYAHTDNLTINPYRLTWVNDLVMQDFVNNGVIAVLTFEVLEGASVGEKSISLSYDNETDFSIYNFDGELINFDLVAGSVTVGAAACTHAGKVAVPAVAPDCENPGNNLYYTCTCGKVLKADGITETTVGDEELTALGHNMQETAARKEPTCEVAGKEAVKTCANGCGKTEGGDVIPAPGHTFLNYVYNNNATCVANGTKTAKCDYCEATDIKVDEAHPATGEHTYDNACDANCNVCNYYRGAAEHVSNQPVCKDGSCINCGIEMPAQRDCGYMYECSATCLFCGGANPNPGDHSSDAEFPCLDGECLQCGAFVPAGDHLEDGYPCDKSCGWCGEKLPSVDHTYDNACDANCSVCGYTREVADHDYVGVVTKPDCENGGWTTYTCSVCGDKYEGAPTDPTGHDMKETAAAVAPKCEVAGKTAVYTCANGCGKTEGGEEIAAKGHDIVEDRPISPKCLETGLTEGSHCTRCDDATVKQEIIPALGHLLAPNWYVSKEATCTEEGEEYHVCVRCFYRETRKIPALGHTEVIDAAVEAGCTTVGKTEGKHCSVCGKVTVAQTEISAKGHDMKETTTAVEPGCETVGYNAITTCANGCGKTEGGEEIAAKGHTPNIPAPTETQDQVCTVCGHVIATWTHVCKENLTFHKAVEATCTEGGNVAYYACTCGKNYADAEATEELANVVIAAKGHNSKIKAGYDATCTEPGLTEGTYCDVCGKVLTEQTEISAKGHNVVADAPVAATCVTDGKTAGSHCDRCNTVLVAQEIITKLGHAYAWDDAVEPTCSSTGLTAGEHCSVCGEILTAQEVVPKLPHTEMILDAVAPTCTITGLTEGKKCSVCNEVTVAQETVPVVDHTEKVLPSVEPTCETAGKTVGAECSVCGATLVEQTIIDALGHDMQETAEAVEPDCDTAGKTAVLTCANGCGKTEGGVEIPASGHQWINGTCTVCAQECDHEYVEGSDICIICGGDCVHEYATVITAPTCTEQGYTTYTCNLCGNSYMSDYTDAKGHSYADATCTAPQTCTACGDIVGEALGHSYSSKVTAPTCTEGGYTLHACNVCGHKYVSDAVDALGHTNAAPVEENRIEATCTAEGKYYTVVYCTVCEDEVSRVETVIPAKEHNYTEKVVAPTCEAAGYTAHTCTACGHSYPTDEVPALGHTAGETVDIKEGTDIIKYYRVVKCTDCGGEASRVRMYLQGDVNLNGMIDLGDITMLIARYLGDTTQEPFTYIQEALSEFNGFEELDLGDVTMLISHYLGDTTQDWKPGIIEVNEK